MGVFDIKLIMDKVVDLQDQTALIPPMNELWKKTVQLETMQKFMNDPNEKFDVAIVEWLYSELVSGISAVFDCPYIWSSSMDPHTFVVSLIHEHMNTAYTFHHMSTTYSYSFQDRVKQLWIVGKVVYYKWLTDNKESEDFKQLYESIVAKKGRKLPAYEDVKYNASFMLGNSDFLTGDNIALPQNYKHVGGYFIKENIEPLPQNLQEIFDNAKDGVIYFSMGSNLKSKNIPDSIKRELLDVFSELKQTVIWKLEVPISDVPKNVHIVPWAPQQSILAQPNCVLFITHGGLLSLMETLHAGKPIIGIPFFADQYININRAVAKGFGKRLDFGVNVAQNLRVKIKEMLDNPSYQQRAKELSIAFNHRLVPPGKELVHWVEHVIKTNGAPHLRSVALNVSWYKKLYLDLLLVILLVLILVFTLLKYLIAKKVSTPKKKAL